MGAKVGATVGATVGVDVGSSVAAIDGARVGGRVVLNEGLGASAPSEEDSPLPPDAAKSDIVTMRPKTTANARAAARIRCLSCNSLSTFLGPSGVVSRHILPIEQRWLYYERRQKKK